MEASIGLLFLGHAKYRAIRELARHPGITTEQVIAGGEMVNRQLIDQAAAKVANGTSWLETLDAQSTGLTIAMLWTAIVAFFESPTGQAIIQALVAMILAALGL